MNNSAKKIKHNALIEMETSNKIYLTNAYYVDQALRFIELIHKNNTGHFCLCKKDINYFSTRFLNEKPNYNTMMNYLHLEDLYLSINSFYVPLRKSKAIRQINSLFIDLDYYKVTRYKNKTTQEMIKIMTDDGMFDNLKPSFFVDSGNGMYIFYLLNDVPKQMTAIWQQIENYLVDQFERYGADKQAKDVSRVLKVCGSINSKTGRRVTLIADEDPIRYNLIDIKEKLMPNKYTKEEWNKLKELRKKRKREYKTKTKNKSDKIKYLFTIKSLNYNRALDISKLIELRNFDIKGQRDFMLYLYGLFTMYHTENIEQVKQQVNILNKSLKEPLEGYETESMCNTIMSEYNLLKSKIESYGALGLKSNLTKYLREQGCIIYSNEGVIKRLGIQPTEMEHLKTLIDKTEKAKRKRNKYQENKENISIKRKIYYQEKLKKEGKKSKKEQLQIIYAKIKSLRMKGYKNEEIAIELSLPIRTLKRHITHMKKNGLF